MRIKDLEKDYYSQQANIEREKATWDIYNETVGRLRKLMVDTCLALLNADIFIMDEFQ